MLKLELEQLTLYAQQMGSEPQSPITLDSSDPDLVSLAQVLETTRHRLWEEKQELITARQASEMLVQSLAEGIITCDRDGRILFFSEGAERIMGWENAAAQGQPLDRVLPLASSEGQHFRDYLPLTGERRALVVRHRNGNLLTLVVTRTQSIIAEQFTIIIQDTTEETGRRKAQSHFLANMSHEFRTPLAGMEASLELLRENLYFLSPAEIQQLLNSIHLSLSMLHQLIDNLLESSKLEAHHFALTRRASELEPLLGEAIRLVDPMVVRRNQRLTVEEPLVLPRLLVDPTRTIQMMVNLLSNASKYSPVESVIDLQVQLQGEQLWIGVADRGSGIAPEQREAVFLPFVRLSPHFEQGSGLGLSVVKAIAEAHQGQVGVEARSGGGSVFWVTLPVMERPR